MQRLLRAWASPVANARGSSFVTITVSAYHGGADMAKAKSFVEEIELRGHIIDSLLLPKVLDEILTRGGTFVLKDVKIGERQTDQSHARIEVRAPSAAVLDEILGAIHEHGAAPVNTQDCTFVRADMDG